MNDTPQRPLGGYFAPAEPAIDEVTDGVLVARNFHIGNVITVATREGAVVIDTTGSSKAAAAARDALWERGREESRYVIYTHCHNDHVRGADAFLTDRTEAIVGHELLEELQDRDMRRLGTFLHGQLKSHQLGDPVEAGGSYYGHQSEFIPPTLTFKDSLDLDVGELGFHLEHTEGETRDHLLVWIPERSVLCCGDLFYHAFPNLSSPAVGPRPIRGWIRSLERFIEFEPLHLVPSHGPAVSGRDNVRDTLTAYRDAIAFVWDESIKAIDAGIPVHEAARQLRLPPHLAAQPFLQELYGTVNWGVRAVYDGLLGWYDGDPSSLNPLPTTLVSREIALLAGVEPLVDRARQAHADGDDQLALELLRIALTADPGHPGANTLQAKACRRLVQTCTSANEKNFYLSGALIAESRLADPDERQPA